MTARIANASALNAVRVASGFSGGGDNCVRAAALGREAVAVRDSEDPAGSSLLIRPEAWSAFAAGIRAGGPGA